MPMPNGMFYIADILHNLLRVVPQIFLPTVQEKCHEEQLKEVGQWCYDNVSLTIKGDIYLQTYKGVVR
jgi:predicted transport protein